MNYGITAQGFIRKPYNVILEELQIRAKAGDIFGEDIDLSDLNLIGPEIKLMAWALDKQWQLAEQVYYSIDIDAAEGVPLNRLVALGLVDRQNALYAAVTLVFAGEAGSIIPAGTICSTPDKVDFATDTPLTLNAEGTGSVAATCTVAGIAGNVYANTLTSITNPISGVNTVNNPLPAINGRDMETDIELRNRYKTSPNAYGSNIDSIISTVSKVQDVVSVNLIVNDSNIVNGYGLPPHSMSVIVSGGDDDNIAVAIFKSKPAGIKSNGEVERLVLDSTGYPRKVRFSRSSPLPIYVQFTLTTTSEWLSTAENYIKNDTVSYINSLSIGTEIFGWNLILLLADYTGIKNVSVKLGLSAGDITLDQLEIPLTNKAVIDITSISVVYEV